MNLCKSKGCCLATTPFFNLQSIKTYIFLEKCSQSSSINNPSCFVVTKLTENSVKIKKLLLINHKQYISALNMPFGPAV